MRFLKILHLLKRHFEHKWSSETHLQAFWILLIKFLFPLCLSLSHFCSFQFFLWVRKEWSMNQQNFCTKNACRWEWWISFGSENLTKQYSRMQTLWFVWFEVELFLTIMISICQDKENLAWFFLRKNSTHPLRRVYFLTLFLVFFLFVFLAFNCFKNFKAKNCI